MIGWRKVKGRREREEEKERQGTGRRKRERAETKRRWGNRDKESGAELGKK